MKAKHGKGGKRTGAEAGLPEMEAKKQLSENLKTRQSFRERLLNVQRATQNEKALKFINEAQTAIGIDEAAFTVLLFETVYIL